MQLQLHAATFRFNISTSRLSNSSQKIKNPTNKDGHNCCIHTVLYIQNIFLCVVTSMKIVHEKPYPISTAGY